MAGPSSSSTMPAWRTFQFMEKRDLADDVSPQVMKDAHTAVYAPPTCGAWASPHGALLLGLRDGQIRMVDAKTYIELATWPAFSSDIWQLHVAPEAHAILAVGQDLAYATPIVRIWRLTSPMPSSWTPVLHIQMRLVSAHTRQGDGRPRMSAATSSSRDEAPVPATACAVSSSLTCVAVGLHDGSLHVARDLSTHLTSAEVVSLRPKLVRDSTLLDEGRDAWDSVTGMTFCPSESANDTMELLFSTVSKTMRYTLSGAGAGTAPSVVDTVGCAPSCAASLYTLRDDVDHDDPMATHVPQLCPRLILAREEALYVMGPRGRDMSIALEGAKAHVHVLLGQVVVVLAGAERQRITVFDVDAKCITYTKEHTGVSLVWTSAGDPHAAEPERCVGLVTQAGTWELVDKPLMAKWDHLFRAHLFLQALPFLYAHAARLPYARLPTLSPSAVILPPRPQERRRVSTTSMLVADVYRRYGEHLYARGDFEGAMQQFIKTLGVVSPSYIIRQFLDAQRLQYLTAYLEALHKRHLANADHTTLLLHCYTKLRHTEALDRFIRASDVSFDVHVAMDVCRRAGCVAQAAYLAAEHQEHDTYLSIQVREAHDATAALAYVRALSPADALAYVRPYVHALLEAAPREMCDVLVHLYTHAKEQDEAALSQLLVHFVGHERELEHFFEQVIAARAAPSGASSVPAADAVLLYDTLLELYLTHAPTKALAILQSDAPYTAAHALVLCTNANYTDGLLCVYERMDMMEAIVMHWIDQARATPNDAAASQQVIEALHTYGERAPSLYTSVLQFLTSDKIWYERHQSDLQGILSHTTAQNLLSPIQLVHILGRNDVAQMGLLTPLLLAHVQQERAEYDSATKLIASYREEAAAKTKELAALRSTTEPRVFQQRECGVCTQPLDLPSVHFMCRHSFHYRCLPSGEEARVCPLCARDYATVQTLQDAASHMSYDVVQSEVDAADDGFDVIADLFSKGVVV